MLTHADSVIHSISSLLGGPPPESIAPNKISLELLSTLNIEASLAAAYRARQESFSPELIRQAQVGAARQAPVAMLEARRSTLFPQQSLQSSPRLSGPLHTLPAALTHQPTLEEVDEVQGVEQEEEASEVDMQLHMCINAAERDLDLTSAHLDLVTNFTSAAHDLTRSMHVTKSFQTTSVGGDEMREDAKNCFDQLSDAALRDYAVGLVYLITKSELQPHVADAASSLLLLLGKDAHARTEAIFLSTCAPGGLQAFFRLPELLWHGSDDIKLSVAQVFAALHANSWFANLAGPSGAVLALVRMLSSEQMIMRCCSALALRALCSSSPEATKAVLLCNAVPKVLDMLWSESSEEFTSATVLMHVLLARMPRVEQQALLQEMLGTGALLRLLLVMTESRWVGVEWQSAVSIVDLMLIGAQSETVRLFAGYAATILNDLLSSGDCFLAGIAAKLVQGIVKRDAAVLLQSGFDISGLVRILLDEESPDLVKQLVVFTVAKMATKSGSIELDDNVRRLTMDGLESVCKMCIGQPWTTELHQVLKAAGESMVQMAQPDELKDDLPKRLIKSGALIAFVWLVIHHEANPSFQAVVVTALELILKERSRALKMTVEGCLTLEQIVCLVRDEHDMQLRSHSTELLARYGAMAMSDKCLAAPFCAALVHGPGVSCLVSLVADAATAGQENRRLRTLAASAVQVLAEVAIRGGPNAELALADAGAVPATLAVVRQALSWASWLEAVCKPGLDLLCAMAVSGVSDFTTALDTDEAARCMIKLLNCSVILVKSQAIKLLACTVAASEKVRAALTSSEAEVAQLMSGLRTDAGLEVNCSTARVIEVLAMHYFYSLTEEWVLHALARMVKEANNEAVRQQGLATLGSLANSLQRGGSVTSEQMHSFALTCAKTGAIQNAVDLLGAEASTMQLKESAVLFVSSLSGRAGVPVEICKAGAVEPLALLLITPGTWLSVEKAVLQTVDQLVQARACKADSLHAHTLMEALSGRLNPAENSPATVDQAFKILASLSEQGQGWVTLLLSEPRLMSLVYRIANNSPANPASSAYASNAQADAYKILRRIGSFPPAASLEVPLTPPQLPQAPLPPATPTSPPPPPEAVHGRTGSASGSQRRSLAKIFTRKHTGGDKADSSI